MIGTGSIARMLKALRVIRAEQQFVLSVQSGHPAEVRHAGHRNEGSVYKILEVVGSSEKSIEDAIQNAITRPSKTIREMKWFEVVQTRGHIENGSVRHY